MLLVTGCATYTPQPLGSSDGFLAPPVAEILRQDALAIDRPYLRPVDLDLSQPLDANAIAILAVINNPDLKAMRTRAGVSDAQVFAAGLLPDPTFSAGIDHIIRGPDPVDNLVSAFGFDLNSIRTRGAVRARTEAEARQVRLDLAWAEWQAAGQARIQAERVLLLRQQVEILNASRDSTASLLDRNLRAAGRGDISADQVQAARIAAFDAEDRARTAQTGYEAARYELTRYLGLPPAYPLTIANLPPPIAPPSADQLFAVARDTRTDLAALRAGYDAQEATVRKAVLDQFPNLGITLNAARDTGTNVLVGPAIDFTLPLWNRNRGGIAIERATRDALRAEYEARLFQTRADIAAAIAALALAREQRGAILENLPALTRFAAANRRAANRGDLALATAETAEQALRDQQYLLTQSEQQIAEQTIMLELLTGALEETWPR